MELGKTNRLTIARLTDFGYFLEDEEQNEVLLPNAYVTEAMNIGEEIDVFLYLDSEERIIATTLKPFAESDEFAYLLCKQVNEIGAFMDWGIMKDLFVPFREQLVKFVEGQSYLVFIYIDEVTDRILGSSKENDFLFFDDIKLQDAEEVDLLIYKETDLGFNCIVNNLHKGLIFRSDIHKKISPGDKIKGYVKKVREDGKLDIVLEPMGYRNVIDKYAEVILATIKERPELMKNMSDKSSTDFVNEHFGMSKKAFKRGLGYLYKNGVIVIKDDGIEWK